MLITSYAASVDIIRPEEPMLFSVCIVNDLLLILFIEILASC